ncbi:MAG: DUF3788 family protein [Tannerellaceae bacterium]|nr:DUF3788 family protein [Tannerellaceae bacterium]
MKTKLIHIDNIPNEQELVFLLGKNVYEYYNDLCKTIMSLLLPDTEIWDNAGRRGKYFHGYRVNKHSMLIDLYLYSVNTRGYITCEFHFVKRDFLKIAKKKNLFNKQIQQTIDWSIKFNEEYGGGYSLDIKISDKETLQNTIQIIQIISGNI